MWQFYYAVVKNRCLVKQSWNTSTHNPRITAVFTSSSANTSGLTKCLSDPFTERPRFLFPGIHSVALKSACVFFYVSPLFNFDQTPLMRPRTHPLTSNQISQQKISILDGSLTWHITLWKTDYYFLIIRKTRDHWYTETMIKLLQHQVEKYKTIH